MADPIHDAAQALLDALDENQHVREVWGVRHLLASQLKALRDALAARAQPTTDDHQAKPLAYAKYRDRFWGNVRLDVDEDDGAENLHIDGVYAVYRRTDGPTNDDVLLEVETQDGAGLDDGESYFPNSTPPIDAPVGTRVRVVRATDPEPSGSLTEGSTYEEQRAAQAGAMPYPPPKPCDECEDGRPCPAHTITVVRVTDQPTAVGIIRQERDAWATDQPSEDQPPIRLDLERETEPSSVVICQSHGQASPFYVCLREATATWRTPAGRTLSLCDEHGEYAAAEGWTADQPTEENP